ncbi:cytochrome P450 [Annulohypoxylon bovei var. microspora]|nr:cytochrome P450 [Annulohypoxylon bovei var. microspora]
MALRLDFMLSTQNASLIISATLIASVIWYAISTATAWNRLRQFPGPTLAKFSYLWGFFAMRTGHMHHIVAREQHKYGKIMRIGPNELLVYDSDTLWQINGVRSGYERGGWYASIQFDPYGHSVLSEPNTERHDKRKAQIMGGYAGKGNVNLEEKVDSQLGVLVDVLRTNYLEKGDRNIVDFGRLIRFFQVDLVTLVGSGEPWGDLVNETDHFDFISIADSYVPFLHTFMMTPLFRHFFSSKFFLRLAGPKATDKKGMGKFLGIIKGIVERRFNDGPSQPSGEGDMLDEWIKQGLSRRECELELAIQVPAGSETSTTAIRGIMLHLLTAPNVYLKLQREITARIRDGHISSPVTQEEAKQLPYLQAIIYEGIRMVSPSIIGFPKKVPMGGDTICGKFVPEGTDIFVNLLSMLQNKEVFGEDADMFRPERFLECHDNKKAQLIKNVDLAFGHGRWVCAGKTLAWFELNKIFIELFRNFDFQIANPESPWACRGYSSFLIDNFWVRVMERSTYESW